MVCFYTNGAERAYSSHVTLSEVEMLNLATTRKYCGRNNYVTYVCKKMTSHNIIMRGISETVRISPSV